MNTKKTLLVFLSFILVFSLFLGACAKTDEGVTSDTGAQGEKETTEATAKEPKVGGDLVIGAFGNPKDAGNPLWSNDTASSEAIKDVVFDALVKVDENFVAQPSMAERWETSDDGLTWTFYLKDNIKWHDGTKFTAEDVKFTYDIPRHEDYDGFRASDFEAIESVNVIDPLTVEVKFSRPYAKFIMVTAAYEILPKHILGDVPVAEMGEHEFSTSKPIGTGPFMFSEWKDGEYVKVVAFDDYHAGRPYLDSITTRLYADQNALLAALEGGSIDMMIIPQPDVNTAKEWEEKGSIKLHDTLALSYTYLGYNLRNDLFKDVKVRQAITHALDRETIIGAVMEGYGEVAHTPTSPLSWAYNPDTPQFEFNVEKAKQLLAEAGWEPGPDGILVKDGKRFSFELKTNQGNKVREDLAVIAQEQLKEVGIEVKINIMEWSAFINDVNPPNWKFDAIILGWALGMDPDPKPIWHSDNIQHGNNSIAYSRSDLDALMDEQNETLDPEERKKMIWKILNEIALDQPYTFLYYPMEFVATPTNLEGFTQHPRLRRYKAHEWWLDK
ncbi:peptide-binding protein [Caldalkalibacillus mannanilyticus]|uniref:peptide-binding protein n=1 Tax=Caldalkalibacillus mannanilyticus TaxID=1418 RepID=UPI000467EFCA|nr:peptide-binding protein [Caldalkalibacillus mannanilyticus]